MYYIGKMTKKKKEKEKIVKKANILYKNTKF